MWYSECLASLYVEMAVFRVSWKFGTVYTEIDIIPGMLLCFFMLFTPLQCPSNCDP